MIYTAKNEVMMRVNTSVADHLMFDVSNVTIASKCCLEDPKWKPPFEAGIVITNFAFNGDESTPHLHMYGCLNRD